MKESFTKLMKSLYPIRKTDSLLCVATLTVSAYMASSNELHTLTISTWLIIIPILYLVSELILIFIYKKSQELDKKSKLNYSLINQNKKIALKINYSQLLIGNIHILDNSPKLIPVKSLITAKILGIMISLTIIIQFLLPKTLISAGLFALAFIISMIKRFSEGLLEELSD
jgi:Na+/H+-translocating membrane pyrophosphatase